MKCLLTQFGLVLVAWVGSSCRTVPKSISDVAGCYAVAVGRWNLHPHGLRHPNAPPDSIRLTTTLINDSSQNHYKVVPHAFDESTRGAASYWTRLGDSVVIDWSVAFAQVEMRVIPTNSGLAGRVESQTDLVSVDEHGQVPWPSANVRLRRTPCSGADAA
jgi:hypothetical protein